MAAGAGSSTNRLLLPLSAFRHCRSECRQCLNALTGNEFIAITELLYKQAGFDILFKDIKRTRPRSGKRKEKTMPPIGILIKPSSSKCNLRCRYCFYHSVAENRETGDFGLMSLEVIEEIIKKTLRFRGCGCHGSIAGRFLYSGS